MKLIDVVIPWVDGNDFRHKKKRDKYKYATKNSLASSYDDIRFEQSNEIYYCIKSILKFMPWVRNIYLVTDQQTPFFLQTNDSDYKNVIIVDHREIFYGLEEYLPTFNSRSLASCFWRIKNISEYFIVFNDDLILLNPISYNNFFEGDKVVVYGGGYKFRFYRDYPLLRNIISWYRNKFYKITTSDRIDVTQKTARVLGFKKEFFLLDHCPMVFYKKSFEYFFKNKTLLDSQIKYKFRNSKQYLPEAINSHYLLKNSLAIVKSSNRVLSEIYAEDLLKVDFSFDQIFNSNKLFLCAQSIEKYPIERKKQLFLHLEKLLEL